MRDNINIISWNVRGLNCPNKRGDVKWVLRNFRCDIAILQETKMEEVTFATAISLWDRRSVDWIVLPLVGRPGGIVIIWDDQTLELIDSKVGTYAICGKFKSLNDDFAWGRIGVYGPNDDNLRFALFDELKFFMSQWDIPWCLEGDFNVVRSPYERSSKGRLSSPMLEFSYFISVCGLIDPPLKGGRYTWSGHEVVPVLSPIDCFLFSVE